MHFIWDNIPLTKQYFTAFYCHFILIMNIYVFMSILTVPINYMIVLAGTYKSRGHNKVVFLSCRRNNALSGGYFGLVFTLRGKLHQLGSPNLQDIFVGG